MNLTKQQQISIGLALIALMAVTRGHHFASISHLPSASLAVFFLAGLYLRSAWAFGALLVEAAFIDFVAINYGGVSGFCVTPAYGFLLPAYGSVWLAGRWFATRYSFNWSALLPLVAAIAVGTSVAELFSSGGFYFFGGRYVDPTLAEFGVRLMKYFPKQLSSFAFWIGVAAIVHAVAILAIGKRTGDLKA